MPVSMPQFRFPFTRKTQPAAPSTGHGTAIDSEATPTLPPAHRREKSTSSISIISRNSREEDSGAYKLSVVNDSGVYLPPSPVEKKGFWGRTESSTSSIKDMPDTQEGGFAIPRESLDGYRRSFDISAKTQVNECRRHSLQSSRSSFEASGWGRPSLDAIPNRLPSIDVSESASEEDEEEFRDVELNDSAPQKKKSFLGRFVGSNAASDDTTTHGRNRSSTLTWRREHNKDAEELGAIIKDGNLLVTA